jgi:hypothetical protein
MPLPAPYSPPWKRLGEDGVAMLAWLGLKVRELWRRNGEGSLPVPAFWPRRGSRLFWPLVLAGVLILALALGRAWLARPAPAPVAEAPPPAVQPEQPTAAATARDSTTLPAPSPLAAPAPTAMEGLSEAPAMEEVAAPPGDRSGAPPGAGPEGPATTDARAFTDDPAEVPAAETFEPPAEVEANRLRAQWGAEDRDQLIAALSPDPASLTLTLQLNPAYLALPAAKRQRWAEEWLQRAIAAGYSHLHLRDGQRRLLGREALVGGGMVLLEPPWAGREAP